MSQYNSAQLIYRAAIASYVNPAYESKKQAEVAGVGLDDEGRPLSPVEKIEKYFSLIDTNGHKKVTAKDLAAAWASSVKEPSTNDLELIAREIDRFMKMADLDNDGYVSLNEYVNYMLTLISEPDESKRFEIHGLLAEKCHKDPQLADRLLAIFLEKDTVGEGEIPIDKFKEILDRVKLKDSKKLQIAESVFKQRTIGYAQYVMLMLGRTPTKVSLISYDISGKATKNLSRILFGKKIEGIWHTSILAFGYEWWYGGDCFQSRPFSTPFGPTPDKVEDLGETTRTLSEVKDFIRNRMRKKYNYNTYDVINNNCNHFSNDVSMFLCHVGIRKTIVSLPGDLLSGGLAKVLRPFLNKWLGGFSGADDESGDVLSKIREEKAATDRDFYQPGDIAMWKRSETEMIYCEVLEVRKDGKIMIKIFKNMKFKNKLLRDSSFLVRIPKQEIEEHEKSINYLIALSILESQRNSSNKSIVRQFTKNLIEGLITGEDLKNPPTLNHRMSVIAPGGISDDDDGGNGLEDEQKNCLQRCWARCTRKSS
jgi:Ca2+-binding EF-hand superfamily protein